MKTIQCTDAELTLSPSLTATLEGTWDDDATQESCSRPGVFYKILCYDLITPQIGPEVSTI
jgi:hypothetical protein